MPEMTSTARTRTAIAQHDRDDVAVATHDLEPGDTVEVLVGSHVRTLVVRDRIPIGHKISLRPMAAGTDVRKYGEVIGRLSERADEGAHIHVHNLKSLRGPADPSLSEPPAGKAAPE
jgi:altronate dehydratase small subunit